jgi:thiamine-monophosphate kinase
LLGEMPDGVNLGSLGQLGELKVIRIVEHALGASRRAVVGFGDDVSAVRLAKHEVALLKTDMLVGSTDVPPGMSMRQTARKAVVANVSDLAAKGARPFAGIVALGLPESLTQKDVKEIAAGLAECAKEYGFPLVGGDTNESNDLVISIALFALMDDRRMVLRSGARVGDVVAVTGDFGYASAGLKALLDARIHPDKLPQALAQAVYHPKAELDLGLRLARSGALTASIDSSDGLAWSLHELSKRSKVGIQLEQVPISKAAVLFASRYGYDAADLALYGGEEYHLVVTVRRNRFRFAERIARGRLKPIGVVTRRSKGLRLAKNGNGTKIQMRGWEHFRH